MKRPKNVINIYKVGRNGLKYYKYLESWMKRPKNVINIFKVG
jgi:hypothetical protein